MTKYNQDVTMPSGDHRLLVFGPVKNEDGSYADLAGAAAIWQMAKSPSGQVLVTKDTGGYGGVTIVSATVNGQLQYTVRVQLKKGDTQDLPPSIRPAKWWHECVIIDASGNERTISTGAFDLRASPRIRYPSAAQHSVSPVSGVVVLTGFPPTRV